MEIITYHAKNFMMASKIRLPSNERIALVPSLMLYIPMMMIATTAEFLQNRNKIEELEAIMAEKQRDYYYKTNKGPLLPSLSSTVGRYFRLKGKRKFKVVLTTWFSQFCLACPVILKHLSCGMYLIYVFQHMKHLRMRHDEHEKWKRYG